MIAMCCRYISGRSMVNTVCTLFELSQGEETEQQEFHGLEDWLLMRALRTLEVEGKAELLTVGDLEGVKFF